MSVPESVKTAASTIASDRRYTYALVLGVVIALGLYGLWFFQIEPVYGWLAGSMVLIEAAAVSLVEGIKTGIAGLTSAFVTQPIGTITATLASAGAVYGIVSKIRADHQTAKVQAEAATQVAEAQKAAISAGQKANMAEDKIKGLETQIEGYKNDTSFVDAQKIISEQRAKITTLTDTKAELEKLVADLKLKEKEVVH